MYTQRDRLGTISNLSKRVEELYEENVKLKARLERAAKIMGCSPNKVADVVGMFCDDSIQSLKRVNEVEATLTAAQEENAKLHAENKRLRGTLALAIQEYKYATPERNTESRATAVIERLCREGMTSWFEMLTKEDWSEDYARATPIEEPK